QRIILPRPVSAEESVLRDALLPQMIETLGRNRARQVAEAAFFEIGRVFFQNNQPTYTEDEHLVIGLMGAAGRTGLKKRAAPSETESFLWLKGILEALCRKLLIRVEERPAGPAVPERNSGLAFRELTPEAPPPALYDLDCFAKNRAVAITLDGTACGVMGLVRPTLAAEWRLAEHVAVLEIRLAPLLERLTNLSAGTFSGNEVTRTALPVYPAVARDMALRIGNQTRHGDIVSAIWKIAPKELTTVKLFDIYTGDEIGVGYKSMAYTLTYRSPDRTLTDEEVNRLHENLKERLRNELAIEIREG
ncbi:MAG: hypothetical protein HYV36_01590, partial [Lentisphaerae bacterium]|nr:hypothetical protein [Lentisphaerota bacterium]